MWNELRRQGSLCLLWFAMNWPAILVWSALTASLYLLFTA